MPKFYKITNKSFSDLGVKTYEELWKKAQKKGYDALQIACFTNIRKSQKEDNLFHAIFSTATEDRHYDIVRQDWNLKYYKKNPVYLDSHNYNSIEHIIGKVKNIKVVDNKLQGDIVFALDNPKGVLAYNLASGGFLNTSSVGFIPNEFDDKGVILKSELLEVSAVSVPANPEALFEKKFDEKKIEKKNDNEPEKKETQPEVKSKKKTSMQIIAEAAQAIEDRRNKYLQKIAQAAKLLGESTKAETRPQDVRAKNNSLVNKAVRSLLKLKENI